MLAGSLVPWTAMRPSPVPKCISTFEWPESPNAIGPYGPPDELGRKRSRTKNCPVGVGVDGAPMPTALVSTTAWSAVRITWSWCAPVDTSTSYVGADSVTSLARTQPVELLGRVGRIAWNQPPWRATARSTNGEPSSLVGGSDCAAGPSGAA